MIVWLFLIFTVGSYWEEFMTFLSAALAFNIAVLAIMAIGVMFLVNAGIRLVLLGGTFGALAYKRSGYEFYLGVIDKIMPANIAHMFYSRKSQEKMLFTNDESREVIAWLEDSFASQRGYVNFFINTPLLIGLFGTFTGLLQSIDEMGKIVISLTGDINLNDVVESFAGPLSGMAIGFGSSLFAVGVAVILGIKGYVLFKYQDIMIEGIEEWLKERIVNVSLDSEEGAEGLPEQRESFLDLFIGEMGKLTTEIGKVTAVNQTFASMSGSLASLNTQAAEQKEQLDKLILVTQETRDSSSNNNSTIIELLSSLSDHLKTQKELIGEVLKDGSNLNHRVYDMLGNLNENLNGVITSIKDQGELFQNSDEAQLQNTKQLLDAIKETNSSLNEEISLVKELKINSEDSSKLLEKLGGANNEKFEQLLSTTKNSNEQLKTIISLQEIANQESKEKNLQNQENLNNLFEGVRVALLSVENSFSTQIKTLIDSNSSSFETLDSTTKNSLDELKNITSKIQNLITNSDLLANGIKNSVDTHLQESLIKLEQLASTLNELKSANTEDFEGVESVLRDILSSISENYERLESSQKEALDQELKGIEESSTILNEIRNELAQTSDRTRESDRENTQIVTDSIESLHQKLDTQVTELQNINKTLKTKQAKSQRAPKQNSSKKGGLFSFFRGK